MELVELVTIACVSNRTEFALAQGMLESHGIEAQMGSDDAGGLEPTLGYVRGYGVRVRLGDVTEAQELLTDVGVELLTLKQAVQRPS